MTSTDVSTATTPAPTKGLQLAFEPGMIGLKFVCAEGKYPEANGLADMEYINALIDADERRRRRLWHDAPCPECRGYPGMGIPHSGTCSKRSSL